MSVFQPLYRLKKYLLLYRRDLVVGFICVVIANVVYSVLPKILQYTIDKIEQGIAPRKLLFYAGLIVAATILHSSIRIVMRRIILGVARKIEYHLRNDYFRHLQRLSLKFFVNNRTGDLMSRATNDVSAVAMTIGRGFMFFFSNIIVFIVVIYLMFKTDVKLTLLVLIPFPFVIWMVYKSMKFFFKIFENIQEQFSDITTKAQENISGARVIKAYVQEEHETEQFRKLNEKYLQESLKLAKARGLMGGLMEFLFGISFVILIGVGGLDVIHDHISIGDFVAFMVWLGMLGWPIISFGWIINLIQRASASMTRINKIMDEVPEIQDSPLCDYSIRKIEGDIAFNNVSFSYNGKNVLKNINLKIKRGMTVAIVGPTGSGKTTLVNLIPRLVEATEGEVLVDGVDIKRIPLHVLRKNIGYVPQETFLFSETIEENISFGVKNPQSKEIEWAAKISTIREDLMNFPNKYQTRIGERGVNLSGGQKQRTAISRALLRKPKILILDDALSSVDTYTEEKILKSLQENHFQQTNIIISHRVSSVKHADMIIVLFDGEIIERGNHAELISQKGFYSELYQRQLLQEALEEL